ncbi:site-specific integrase [Streptomyces sp. DK15]|uniref:tyrosine-type recombinase/integrase n=1 Tax=Streptomyces sp. DK15 TaxID=2957499 RepID=UPI0029AE3794|nr:site-specific integrase [Streptomyces sp. DK15]MDX2390687.1 site-specific integrase [Streptomyces sp. DK15]
MAHIRKVQRAEGAAWELRWKDHGKDRQLTFKTEKAAEKELVRIEDLLQAGRSTTHLTERRTVAEVVEACIAAGEGSLKARTVEGQRSMYRNHIKPAFGKRRITSLRAHDIEKWVAALGKKLGHGTVRNVYVLLNKACKYAIRHDWLVVNPCTGVALPTSHEEVQDERQFLTPSQVSALAEVLAKKEGHYGLIVRMAAYTGLRAGELAALRVRDVDMLHGVVQVRRTVRRKAKGGWIYSSPKSKKSARDVPLTGALRAELDVWLAEHPDRANPEARLWPGSRNTGRGGAVDWSRTFDINNFCKRYFRPLLRSGALSSAGMSSALRWHDLRHTYASIMAAVPGVDVYDVSRWMGHSSISVTEKVYVHLFRTDYSSKMAAVDAFLGGAGRSLARQGSVTPLRGAVGQSAG